MVYEQPWPYTAMHSRLCKTPRLCGVCDARLSAAGARLSSRLNDSVPGRPACGVGRCKGGCQSSTATSPPAQPQLGLRPRAL